MPGYSRETEGTDDAGNVEKGTIGCLSSPLVVIAILLYVQYIPEISRVLHASELGIQILKVGGPIAIFVLFQLLYSEKSAEIDSRHANNGGFATIKPEDVG